MLGDHGVVARELVLGECKLEPELAEPQLMINV